jgi:AcrR family transcriptional regulator
MPMRSADPSTSRTQAERSATTRNALADATVELLVERGWAAVTVVEVCHRAAVTRGAFHHHYENLPELLADALRRLYATYPTMKRPPVAADLPGLIDATWAIVGQPRFKAVLEAWLAMANDPSLGRELGPVVLEFASLVNPDASSGILADDARRSYYLMAREALLGLALGRATNRGKPLGHEKAVLQSLRTGAVALEDPRP